MVFHANFVYVFRIQSPRVVRCIIIDTLRTGYKSHLFCAGRHKSHFGIRIYINNSCILYFHIEYAIFQRFFRQISIFIFLKTEIF